MNSHAIPQAPPVVGALSPRSEMGGDFLEAQIVWATLRLTTCADRDERREACRELESLVKQRKAATVRAMEEAIFGRSF